MSHNLRSSFGAQTPRVTEMEELLAESDRLIGSIDNNLDSYGNRFVSRVHSRSYPKDLEIARMYRYCEDIERNLVSMGAGSIYQRFPVTQNVHAMGFDRFSFIGEGVDPHPCPTRINIFEPPAIRNTPTRPHISRRRVNARPISDALDLLSRRRRASNARASEAVSHEQPVECVTPTAAASNSSISNPISGTENFHNCPICLEDVRQGKPFSTLCGHVFCFKCIAKALRFSQKCPVCKKKVTLGKIFRLYI